MKKILFGIFAFIVLYTSNLKAQATYTFNYSGSFYTYTVPANITIISLTVSGAQGGGSAGGGGAVFQHTIGVMPGQVLRIYPGGMGATGSNAPGGFNGGGNAGAAYSNEGSGGGASDVRVAPYGLGNRIIVAGGGGGNGGYAGGSGGPGGLIGGAGVAGQGGAGQGGSATAGGIGGFGNGCGNGTSGALGVGGNGGVCSYGGGGGGGGYYGGGGGGGDINSCCADGGGAGGGSSYCIVAGGSCVTGAWYGAGRVLLKELSGLSIVQVTPIICAGQLSAELSANMSGVGAPFTYSWSTGATTSNISSLGAGTYTCWVTTSSAITYSETFTVTQPPAFASFLNSQTNLFCNGGSNGSISVYGTGGIFPYTYTWSPSGGNLSFASGLTAGTYTCEVADANNCITTVTATLTQPGPVNVVAFASSPTVCIGGSVTLLGGGASNYTWTNGVFNSVAFSPTITASYVVTGFNANGCPGYAQTTITVNPLPTVSVPASSVTTCSGAAITLSATGANTYSWSNNTSGITTLVSPTIATVYTVTGTSTLGCNNTSTVAVGIYSLPVISSILSNSAVCQGGSATMIGLGAFTFTWTGGVTNGIPFTPTATTVYTVSGTNINGCVNSATQTVIVNPQPTITINGPSSICKGNSVMLSASGASTYTWNIGVNTPSVTLSPQSSANYTVTGFSAQGCSNSNIFSLTVNPSPTVSANITNTTLCKGASLLLAGGGATTYTWAPSQTNSSSLSVTPSVTTTYSLTGSLSGCSNSIIITVSVIPTPTLTLASSGTVCANSPVTLTANGATSYTWSGGINSPTAIVSPSVTGWILVTGSSANGCTKTDSIYQVVKPIPALIISGTSSLVCEGETTTTLTVTGANSYSWSTQETDSIIVVTPSVSTSYSVSSTGANGCSNTVSYMITVTICNGINEAEMVSSILIYPNPNNGNFTIKTDKDLKLHLLNSLGQMVQTFTLNENNTHSIRVTGLNNGIYFLVSENQDQKINQKIIITN